ncbi:hypothetical protein OS493_038572 [Desmophyllum pertusum]|uniref:Uncharacterized protein n=1 Tax=Desmophyllum pertusum TaxID=174260 RepID=A0A9X0CCG2_9CNID|nr:hypothetical protein OS493_038572 [Desmophyllum pertusum]
MGEKFNSEILAPVLVPLIVDKLPASIVEKWERDIGDNKEDCLAVKTLFNFLEQVIRAKESSQLPSVESKPLVSDTAWKGGTPKSYPTRRSTYICISLLLLKRSVVFAKRIIIQREIQDGIVYTTGLCFKCLEAGHTSQSLPKTLHASTVGADITVSFIRIHSGLVLLKSHSLLESPFNSSFAVVASSIAANGVGKVVLANYPSYFVWSKMATQKLFDVSLIQVPKPPLLVQSVVEELGLDGKSVRIAVSGFGGRQDKPSLRKRIAFYFGTC